MAPNLITVDKNTYESLQQELIELRQVIARLEQIKSSSTPKFSQKQMALFIEYMPAAIAIFDRQMCYLLASRRWRENYGLVDEEIIGRSCYEVFPEIPEYLREIHQRCLAGAVEKCEEDAFPCADGTINWVKWEIHPWYEDSGEVGGIIIFTEEITARKQTEAALKQLNEELEARVEERTAALRQSEARLKRLADNVPGMLYEFHLQPDGTMSFPYASSGCRNVLGLEPKQITEDASVVFAHIHPEDIPNIQQAIAVSAQTLQNFEYEWRITTPSGEQKLVKGVSRPEPQPKGKILWYGYISDITEQQAAKRDREIAQQQLQEQEQFLRTIYDGIPHLVFVVDVLENGDFRFAGCNSSAEKIIGINHAQIVGKTPEDLHGPINGALVRQRYKSCVEAGTRVNYEEHLTFDGEETWCLTTINPLKNSEGRIYQLVGAKLNITARKKAEQALQESQHFIQRIADSSPNILYIFDLEEQRNVYANQEIITLLGYSIEEIQQMGDKLISTITHPEEQEKIATQLQRLLAAKDGEICEYEYRIRRGNGEWCWLYTRETPFSRTHDGKVKQILGVSTDMTERKQAELRLQQQTEDLENTLTELQRTQTQLIQSEKMSSLGNMVAGVAHEINNPINFIHGNLIPASEYAQDLLKILELYQRHFPSPPAEIQAEIAAIELDFLKEDLMKLLQSMRVGTQRIREIVLSLRNFSRLDEAEFKRVDIHEGIDSTLMILHNRLKAKPNHPEITVIKEYGKLPLIECYAGQLNQVFMNLLSNAIDALDESVVNRKITDNPTIHIRTELINNQRIAIRISDNGMGIPQEIFSKLFDPFFTTKEVGKGTGLGLSISYQIVVDKHCGKLTCHSTPGQGAEFVIEIPINQQKTSQ